MLGAHGQHHDRTADRNGRDAVLLGPQHHPVRRFLGRRVDAVCVRPEVLLRAGPQRRPQAPLRVDDGRREITAKHHHDGDPRERTEAARRPDAIAIDEPDVPECQRPEREHDRQALRRHPHQRRQAD